MPKAQSAKMVSPTDLTVTTTGGHTIKFVAKEPRFVPALAVRECRRYGVKEVSRFRDAVTEVPGVGSAGQVRSDLNVTRQPSDATVAEEELKSNTSEPEEYDTSGDVTFTETEAKIRNATLRLMAEKDPEDFTDNGKPTVKSLASAVPDMTPSSDARDTVWAKMVDNGDVPENWLDELTA